MTITVAGEALVTYLLASIRIVAWLAVVPPFASRAVPAMVKVILALGLAFAMSPALHQEPVAVGALALMVNALTQVFVGLAMGFVTYLLFTVVSMAGSLIDMFGGFAMAQAFDPMTMNMSTVFGKLHQMLATMLLFASGGHLLVVGGLLSTFRLLPIGSAPKIDDTTAVMTTAAGMFFTVAVQIALPMIAVLFIADLALALLTKVAPQLNAINVMFPAKIGLTLLLVGLSFPVLPEAVDLLVKLANEAMATIAGAG